MIYKLFNIYYVVWRSGYNQIEIEEFRNISNIFASDFVMVIFIFNVIYGDDELNYISTTRFTSIGTADSQIFSSSLQL